MASCLVCCAVKEEAQALRSYLARSSHCRLVLTGMGRRNAEAAIQAALKQCQPDYVISAGFAGGLDPALTVGTVVLDTDPEFPHFESSKNGDARPTLFYCAERVAVTAAEKGALRQSTGAGAVEMESSVIRAACRQRGVPGATIRVISDAANEDLPLDFNKLMTPEMNMNWFKLAITLAGRPDKIPALLRFQKQTSAAARNMANVIISVLEKIKG